ncbi:MAG: hypothetical protein Q8S84_08030 [bacterium]|nr:hypothetical protein [bacterium]
MSLFFSINASFDHNLFNNKLVSFNKILLLSLCFFSISSSSIFQIFKRANSHISFNFETFVDFLNFIIEL